jgi:tryptophanyl-tRNA synthetase
MQEDYNCYFFVADYHALTTHPDPKELKSNVFRVLAENIASGLDPEKVTLYAQSDVPEIPELYLILNMLAYMGELEKVPTARECECGPTYLSGVDDCRYFDTQGCKSACRQGSGATFGDG